MLFSLHFEAGLDKRFSVLFQGCNIALFFPYPAKAILEIASKEREAIVHIYNHTDATRREQIEDVSNTIELITGIVTVSDSIDAKDEIKRRPAAAISLFLERPKDRPTGSHSLPGEIPVAEVAPGQESFWRRVVPPQSGPAKNQCQLPVRPEFPARLKTDMR